jgi:hypothetical protein
MLDLWVAGQLSPEDAARAADLVRYRSFAAERVLERLLVAAADASPAIPPALSARVLTKTRPATANPQAAKAGTSSFSVPGWRWWSAGLAFASLAIVVVGYRLVDRIGEKAAPIQVAMVSIDDRSPWSGSRTRSLGDAPAAREDTFNDIDVPADVMRRTVTGHPDQPAAAAQLLTYLPSPAHSPSAQVLVDSALQDRLATDWRTRSTVPVRVYNFDAARAAAVRTALRIQEKNGPAVLFTVRPAGPSGTACNARRGLIVLSACRLRHAGGPEPAAGIGSPSPLG